MANGPLQGLKVIEFAGIGPGPFCGMLLSDMGAEVIRIERNARNTSGVQPVEIDGRGRRSVSVDLKNPNAVAACLALCEKADIVIEGYRPGVMERLGLGPDAVLVRNPRIVYGRMTGWGQHGPYAQRAGHDINYIAITGALDAIGTKDKPVPPLNLVGDYGGGAMMLAVGLLAGVLNARATGQGQVVDASISDGTCYLTAVFYKFVAIGAIEPQFYALLLEKTGLAGRLTQKQMDREAWPEMKAVFAEVFASKTRDQWVEIMGDADTCFAPVLTAEEAAQDPHNVARSTLVEIDGVRQPAPAPRFSRTPSAIQASSRGAASRDALLGWGLAAEYVDDLVGTVTA